MSSALKVIEQHRFVPVASIHQLDHTTRLIDSLIQGGLPIVEITLRTSCGLAAIETAQKNPAILVGAGTVLNQDQCRQAIEAGAKFVVSPGFDEEVVAYCKQQNVLCTPGVVTPTELTRAYNAGVRHVKFFPAGNFGGPSMVQALAAPFPEVSFMPTGGVTLDNVDDYLSCPPVFATGGSWMVKPDLYAGGDFSQVVQRTRELVTKLNQPR